MVRTFCRQGESEAVKGAVHAAGGGLAALMAAYNIAAWCYRRERHLGLNAVVYSIALLWEVRQTRHHIGGLAARPGQVCPEPAIVDVESPRAA